MSRGEAEVAGGFTVALVGEEQVEEIDGLDELTIGAAEPGGIGGGRKHCRDPSHGCWRWVIGYAH